MEMETSWRLGRLGSRLPARPGDPSHGRIALHRAPRGPVFRPTLPPYDLAEWPTLPFPERLRRVCVAWADQGYGSPPAVYLAYLLKLGAYVAGWAAWCTVGTGWALGDLAQWWASDVAFAKFVLWTLLFEGLGFGCGSGPLTGRYLPPVGPLFYFLRPGTTKLPTWPLPGLGHRRTLLDVAAYAAALGALVWALAGAAPTLDRIGPFLLVLPVLGVLDKTMFLAFRPEHHASVLLCLLFPDWLPGAKVVWLAVWWWAATSKVNAHFPAVVAVMASNSPFSPLFWKRAMYAAYPDDLRPSRLAAALAHGGTFLEYAFPLVLALSGGGPVTLATLGVATGFHLFILSQVPMGVPLEWNVIMIYGAWVLFGVHADVPAWSVHSPLLLGWLLGAHLLLPVWGSVRPDQVSFLLAMRYYAGNWATSVWLFRRDAAGASASAKLEALTKWSPPVSRQLGRLYDEATVTAITSKVVAFRAMHLHGRAVRWLAARAVPDLDAVEWLDGEVVAGLAVGWNFGEGHLHDAQLLRAVQAQCGFAPGELRVVFVESQPIHRATHRWRVEDAATGPVAEGELPVSALLALQPYPVAGEPAPTR